MRIGLITPPRVTSLWPGTDGHDTSSLQAESLMQALHRHGADVVPIAPRRAPRSWRRWLFSTPPHEAACHRLLDGLDQKALRAAGAEIATTAAQHGVDILLTDDARYAAYIDTPLPLVTWREAPFACALERHHHLPGVTTQRILEAHTVERAALRRARLTVFQSDWAIATARRVYAVTEQRLAVQPRGGNVRVDWDESAVDSWVRQRGRTICRLLCVGMEITNRRRPRVLDIVDGLNAAGVRASLTILVGPDHPRIIADANVTIEQVNNADAFTSRLTTLCRESHFLLVSHTNEDYADLVPHANANGLPCLAPRSAGLSTLVQDGRNGYTFAPAAPAEPWVVCVRSIMRHYDHYVSLGTNAFRDYETRLSWHVVGGRIKTLLENVDAQASTHVAPSLANTKA